MRDVIFIGHATPEDNDFTLWLQSKLRNEGYNCECDLSFLLGGEKDFWASIQDMLTEKARKYILVLSKDAFKKSGLLDEWEYCKSLERDLNLTDFIIPLKIDDVPFNVRIGLNRRNIIPFKEWGIGLKKLLKKLEADKVPKGVSNTLSVNDWYENVYTNYSGVDYKTQELFYSNWLPIGELPPVLYLYQFENELQAKNVLIENSEFPFIRHGNYLCSFSPSINTWLPQFNFEVKVKNKLVIEKEKAFAFFESELFPGFQDVKNIVVRLLKTAFDKHMVSRGLQKYELANENFCFFFPRINDDKNKGEFILNGKNKNIGVTGVYKDYSWHFAISFSPLLYPRVCYSLKTHIIFTVDGIIPLSDKKKQHSFRRDKGRMMFNKSWRDLLLAFTSLLKSDPNVDRFEFFLNQNTKVGVDTTPVTFNSTFGYIEPTDDRRLLSIDSYYEDDEYYDDLEKEYLNGKLD